MTIERQMNTTPDTVEPKDKSRITWEMVSQEKLIELTSNTLEHILEDVGVSEMMGEYLATNKEKKPSVEDTAKFHAILIQELQSLQLALQNGAEKKAIPIEHMFEEREFGKPIIALNVSPERILQQSL